MVCREKFERQLERKGVVLREIIYLEAINEALTEEMARARNRKIAGAGSFLTGITIC